MALKKNSAFTIVELLIVIVVIGVLATVVVVGYGAVVNNAYDRAVQSDLQKVSDAVNLYNLDNEYYPRNITELNEAMLNASFTANTANYNTDTSVITNHNLNYCYVSGAGSIYGVVAISRSKNIFYVSDSSNGVKQYSGTWLPTADQVCTTVIAGSTAVWRGYASNDLATGPWRPWTGVTNPATITNLADNPSAGANTTGWLISTAGGSASTLSAVSSGGPADVVSSFMRATLDSAPSSSPYGVSPEGAGTAGVPVDSDITYAISAYVRSSCDLGSGMRIDIGEYNASGALIGANSVGATLTDIPTTWQYISRSFTTSSTTDFMQYKFVFSGQTACPIGTTFDVTGVMLVQGSDFYVYSDGATAGWLWNGAAYNSTSIGPIPGVIGGS